MTIVKKYTPGTFCWTDLGTTDVAGAKTFYQGLMDCQFNEMPMESGEGRYTILQVDREPTCALYPRMEADQKAGGPPSWMAYVSVQSVDETVRKAKIAGGKVLGEPMDFGKVGRKAILQDPTGAVFAIWQAKEFIGAGLSEKKGTVCWRELVTPNTDVAGKFYSTVFGWEIETSEMAGMKYYQLSRGEEGVGGMMLPPAKEILPHWMTYWVVDHCDQALAKAQELGGKVIRPVTEIPEMGRFAIISDPQGAVLGVFQFTG